MMSDCFRYTGALEQEEVDDGAVLKVLENLIAFVDEVK
jgi:hypothetical protein